LAARVAALTSECEALTTQLSTAKVDLMAAQSSELALREALEQAEVLFCFSPLTFAYLIC
jgi:hypothetical protein